MHWILAVAAAWAGPDGRHLVHARTDCTPAVIDQVVSVGDEAHVLLGLGGRLAAGRSPDHVAEPLPFVLERAERPCAAVPAGPEPLAVVRDPQLHPGRGGSAWLSAVEARDDGARLWLLQLGDDAGPPRSVELPVDWLTEVAVGRDGLAFVSGGDGLAWFWDPDADRLEPQPKSRFRGRGGACFGEDLVVVHFKSARLYTWDRETETFLDRGVDCARDRPTWRQDDKTKVQEADLGPRWTVVQDAGEVFLVDRPGREAARSSAVAGVCEAGDCQEGAGARSWPDGRRYEGAFREGVPQGRGRWTQEGVVFEGEFLGGRAFEGVLHRDGYTWTGRVDDDLLPDWRGVLEAGAVRYEGGMASGRRTGFGVETGGASTRGGWWVDDGLDLPCVGDCAAGRVGKTLPGGVTLVYEVEDGNRLNGAPDLRFPDGTVYAGGLSRVDAPSRPMSEQTLHALDGEGRVYLADGPGRLTLPDGRELVGNWYAGRPHGYVASGLQAGLWFQGTPCTCVAGGCVEGPSTLQCGELRYEGQVRQGLPHGSGTMTAGGVETRGVFYAGEIRSGSRTSASGVFHGSFRGGLPHRGARYADGELTLKTDSGDRSVSVAPRPKPASPSRFVTCAALDLREVELGPGAPDERVEFVHVFAVGVTDDFDLDGARKLVASQPEVLASLRIANASLAEQDLRCFEGGLQWPEVAALLGETTRTRVPGEVRNLSAP